MSKSPPDVLASRYASEAMVDLWSPEHRILLERQFWLAVLKAQRDLGMKIEADAIFDYEASLHEIDTEAIREREAQTRHDVKARIEVFNELAGHELIHQGMTSRDLTENVEQLQIFKALELIREKGAAALLLLGQRAEEQQYLPLTARTHNVPAQLTTMGKRLAMFGEELRRALEGIDRVIAGYAVRGLKGAVGTQLDLLSLFEKDSERVGQLESRILEHLGLPDVWENVGQVYPRSADHEVLNALALLVAGPSSFASTLRLMAGQGLGSEGFLPGQTGSSAMPHKINSRSCERVNGLNSILHGFTAMTSHLSGTQWNEGDVACSVVRRVALPGAFYAADGLFETVITVLRQMEIWAAAVEAEVERQLPFLLTTTILMEAVKLGVGRETGHEIIKEHAMEAARQLREGGSNDLFERLASDGRLKLSESAFDAILEQGRSATGRAADQVDAFLESLTPWKERFPKAADYEPDGIL